MLSPDDNDYQAWFINGDDIRSAVLLGDFDDGTTKALVTHSLDDATRHRSGSQWSPEGDPSSSPRILCCSLTFPPERQTSVVLGRAVMASYLNGRD